MRITYDAEITNLTEYMLETISGMVPIQYGNLIIKMNSEHFNIFNFRTPDEFVRDDNGFLPILYIRKREGNYRRVSFEVKDELKLGVFEIDCFD